MAPDGGKWRVFVSMVMKLQVPQNVGILLISRETISLSERNETI